MRPAVLLATGLLAAALMGCGGGSAQSQLTVAAAASLKRALESYAPGFGPARVRLAFGGSDALAAQVREQAPIDVFAAANARLPDRLHAQDLVERPVPFATNRLVVAVPRGAVSVRALADLARPGVAIAAGSAGVPVGDYTGQVLGRLSAPERAAILRNIRSREPDVAGVVGKLRQGVVRAGFVYITDVVATRGALRAIELSPALRPQVVYEAAVVNRTRHSHEARAFVRGLLHGRGAAALRAAGFGPPPS